MKSIYKVLIVFFVLIFSVIFFLTNKYVNNDKDSVQSPTAMEAAKGVEVDNIDDKDSSKEKDDCMYVEIKNGKKIMLRDFDKDKKKNNNSNSNKSNDTEELDSKEQVLQALLTNKPNLISSDNKEKVKTEDKSANQTVSPKDEQTDNNTTKSESNVNDTQAEQNDSQESDNSDNSNNSQENTQDNSSDNTSLESQQPDENSTPDQTQEFNSNSDEQNNENEVN